MRAPDVVRNRSASIWRESPKNRRRCARRPAAPSIRASRRCCRPGASTRSRQACLSRQTDRAAASHVGCDRVSVQRDPRSIALADGAALDFGGIGKGYAVDRALAILRARGVTRAKVDFGSSSLGFRGPRRRRVARRHRRSARSRRAAPQLPHRRRRGQHLESARAIVRARRTSLRPHLRSARRPSGRVSHAERDGDRAPRLHRGRACRRRCS